MAIKDLVKEVVKQYKQDKKVFKDNNFFLDNTIDNVFNRYEIYSDNELWNKVFDGALEELKGKAKVYIKEEEN